LLWKIPDRTFKMNTGKLYRFSDSQFVADIYYRFYGISPTSWWGELTLTEQARISDSEGYRIELEDKRQGSCRLRRRVNRAVSGVAPPRYVYHFTGNGPLA
jgi:hypothetical protein